MMSKPMTPERAEELLRQTVMKMAKAAPPDQSCTALGRELLDGLEDGQRTEEHKMQLLSTAYAAALKIIKRSVLNTPTTKEDAP